MDLKIISEKIIETNIYEQKRLRPKFNLSGKLIGIDIRRFRNFNHKILIDQGEREKDFNPTKAGIYLEFKTIIDDLLSYTIDLLEFQTEIGLKEIEEKIIANLEKLRTKKIKLSRYDVVIDNNKNQIEIKENKNSDIRLEIGD